LFKPLILAGVSAIAFGVTSPSFAADTLLVHSGKVQPDGTAPKYAVIRHETANKHQAPKASLPPTWVFTYTNAGKSFKETFVGTAVTGGASTTIPVYIIPIDMVYGTTSYDPTVVTANGVSIIQNILNSPIFTSAIDYKQGTVDLGTTQYEDAFQRATLWGKISAAHKAGYHVLLSTTVEPVQTITIPKANGQLINAFGAKNLIMANINVYDPKIQALIASLKIPSNALPLFITTQTYLASGNTTAGCCIGGYHSTSNALGQPYSSATYITTSGAFSQNVSALSHELGEWVDDPNTNNPVPAACGAGAILEVGDPLEGETNYGGYPYTEGGVTWDLQDLVTLDYFGAPAKTSVNKWTTFQGEKLAFCSNGG
jgi:hypothetical protein